MARPEKDRAIWVSFMSLLMGRDLSLALVAARVVHDSMVSIPSPGLEVGTDPSSFLSRRLEQEISRVSDLHRSAIFQKIIQSGFKGVSDTGGKEVFKAFL